jgi:hypothetical protein
MKDQKNESTNYTNYHEFPQININHLEVRVIRQNSRNLWKAAATRRNYYLF